MISVSDVTFSYQDSQYRKIAINHLSLKIEKGEFVSLIGANGSGKSTLAMLIGGVCNPDSGNILIDGLNINGTKERIDAKQKIAVLFQNPTEHIVSGSVESDLAFSLENYGILPAQIKERVEEALSLFRLTEKRNKHPRELSGGEQQKVAFAGIWALKPKYIICDEVTTYLDFESRMLVMELLKTFTEDGGGVLFITQFPMESLHSDRLMLLNKGTIYENGEPSELIRDKSILKKSGHDVPVEVILDELLMTYSMDLR